MHSRVRGTDRLLRNCCWRSLGRSPRGVAIWLLASLALGRVHPPACGGSRSAYVGPPDRSIPGPPGLRGSRFFDSESSVDPRSVGVSDTCRPSVHCWSAGPRVQLPEFRTSCLVSIRLRAAFGRHRRSSIGPSGPSPSASASTTKRSRRRCAGSRSSRLRPRATRAALKSSADSGLGRSATATCCRGGRRQPAEVLHRTPRRRP